MKQTIDVIIKVGEGDFHPITVKGIPYWSHLAVTPCPRVYWNGDVKFVRGEWSVTHIPTGRRLGPILSRKRSEILAKKLASKDVWDFQAKTRKEVPRRALLHFKKCWTEMGLEDDGR